MRLIAGHPFFELAYAAGEGSAGSRLGDRFPGAPRKLKDLVIQRWDSATLPQLDVLFASLPTGASSEALSRVPKGVKIVDIGGDHRYAQGWAYGLADVWPERMRGVDRVANPGCFPAATLIALAPLLAGKLSRARQHRGRRQDRCLWRGPWRQREQVRLRGGERGSLALRPARTRSHARDRENDREPGRWGKRERARVHSPPRAYDARNPRNDLLPRPRRNDRAMHGGGEALLRRAGFCAGGGSTPAHKMGRGLQSRFCQLCGRPGARSSHRDGSRGQLGKGAAGQAVQNANLICGLPETAGLEGASLWP